MLQRMWKKVVVGCGVGSNSYLCGKTEERNEHHIRTRHHPNGVLLFSVNIQTRSDCVYIAYYINIIFFRHNSS
jgi:hypothetical protein